MKNKYLFTLLFTAWIGLVSAQKEGYNWYFGHQAAVTFNTPTPTSVSGSAMTQGSSNNEGVASISDANGNLLFYTDGQTVYDANNLQMPNGYNLEGNGGASTPPPTYPSAQSSLIIPKPQSNNLYYLFTMRDWKSDTLIGLIGLCYSIVDMSLIGNGTPLVDTLGDIDTANKNILVNSRVREQLTAVYHTNGQDVWIIVHEGYDGNPNPSNNYLAYLLTSTGLSTTPVISSVGMTYSGGNRYGYLKPSNNGKKLCTTLGGSNTTVELLDFDYSTGTVSNPITIETGTMPHAYSSEFSCNDSVLYVVAYDGSFIYQYDISSGNQTSIINSKQNIATGNNLKTCLQIGPGSDNRIYVASNNQTYLSAIEFPNILGSSCNYLDQEITLISGSGRLGLPNIFEQKNCCCIDTSGSGNCCCLIYRSDTITICESDSIIVGTNTYDSTGIYTDTLDGINGCDTIVTTNLFVNPIDSTFITDSICDGDSIVVGNNTYTTTGTYIDIFIGQDSCDSVVITDLTVFPISYVTLNIAICNGDSFAIGNNVYTTPGTHTDTLINMNGCDSIVTTNLSILPDTSVSIDIVICEGDSAYAGGEMQSTSGTFIDTLVAANGCDSIVTTNLTVLPNPTVIIDGKSSVSMCQEVSLSASGALNYLWNTGATTTSITESPSSSTQYSVIGTDANGCAGIDYFDVDVTGEAYVYLPNIFSPTSSQMDNKKLHVFGICVDSLQLSIYDRWGELVFETKDATPKETEDGDCCMFGPGWNGTLDNSGKPLNSASFAYILKGTYKNGEGFYLTGNIILK